jgi:hypothetical protein
VSGWKLHLLQHKAERKETDGMQAKPAYWMEVADATRIAGGARVFFCLFLLNN